jgi:CHAT domain-containing protein
LAGCRVPATSDPAADYSRIYGEFLHGDLDTAAKAASDEKTELLGAEPVWSFKFRLLEAEILQFQGKSQGVVDVLDSEHETFKASGDLYLKKLTLLSLADARLGHPERSAEELQEAQRLSLANRSPLQGEVVRTRGILASRNGHPAEAEESFRESLALARQEKDDYLAATDILNLGYIALQDEHIDEALDEFNASSQLAAKIHADLLLLNSLGNAGWAYLKLGDSERALESFRRAEAEARKLGAADSEIIWLQSGGRALSQLGDLRQAQASYEQAMRVADASHDFVRQAENETALGLLFLRRDQLDAARTHADAAFREARQLQDRPAELDALLVQALIAAAARATNAESRLTRLLHDVSELPSVRWTAADALANLYAAEGFSMRAERWYRASIRSFEAQRNSVQDGERRLPFAANGGELYRDYAEFLISARRSSEALNLLDRARAMSLKDSKRRREPGFRFAARASGMPALHGSQVVLFYSFGPRRSYLWAIDRRGAHLQTLAPEGEFAGRIQAYQASILRSHNPLQEANPDAQWLYRNLVGPVENLIPNNARVLIVPDGPLNGFNMETLLKPGPQGLRYWIDDVSLTAVSSLKLLSRPSRNASFVPTAGGKLLLIGDPLQANAEYDSLPHASAEVQQVERYFPLERRTALTRAQAVPEAYAASHPAQFAYLHFVAHGMASSLRPLDSAIVLSPSAGDPDRYKLYARDIVQQPIDARLVTISACYGSGVRDYAGEGMVGLAWAFLRAGAHQVIAALWEVNDSSTPRMMDDLYRSLTHGAEPDQALRAAKLSMLHSQGVFRKPIYWAAFQLYTGF